MPRVSLGKALCRPALGTGGAGVGAFACLRTSPSDGIFVVGGAAAASSVFTARLLLGCLDDTGSANRPS